MKARRQAESDRQGEGQDLRAATDFGCSRRLLVLAGSKPWNGRYFAPANSFWNGDVPCPTPYTHNTDFSVPKCG
jgi:hypothetical protein